MKHIMLFEAFTPPLDWTPQTWVKPEMATGRWLLTRLDSGSWDSWFGVFDHKALKEIEDIWNTETLCSHLLARLLKFPSSYLLTLGNPKDIVCNRLSPKARYINFIPSETFRIMDPKDWQKGGLNAGLVDAGYGITPGGEIEKTNAVWELSVLPSETPLELPDEATQGKEFWIGSHPIDLNQLYWSPYTGSGMSTAELAPVGHITVSDKPERMGGGEDEECYYYRSEFVNALQNGLISMEDIQPYMEEIVEKGIPKGFLKIVEAYKNYSEPGGAEYKQKYWEERGRIDKVTQENRTRTKAWTERTGPFLEEMRLKMCKGEIPNLWREFPHAVPAGSKEDRAKRALTALQKWVRGRAPYVQKMREAIQDFSQRYPDVDWEKHDLDRPQQLAVESAFKKAWFEKEGVTFPKDLGVPYDPKS